MQESQAQRARVYDAFRTSHGAEVAGDLLELIPPVDGLRAEMHTEFAAVRMEMAQMASDLRREMHEQTNRYIQWTFAAVGIYMAISTSVTALLVQHLT